MKTTPIGPCYQCDYSFEFPLLYCIATLKSIIYYLNVQCSMFNVLHAIHFNWYVYLVKRFYESIAIDGNI